AAASAGVLALALHVAIVSQEPMRESMRLTPPAVAFDPAFRQERVATQHYKPFDPEPPTYPAMLGNRGVLKCYGLPPLGRVGALAADDPSYGGEVTTSPASEGDAVRIADWSPNRVVAELGSVAAHPTTLVYNTNYDDGWTSDRGPVIDVDGRVGVEMADPRAGDRVTLVYRPRLLGAGLLLGAAGLACCGALAVRARRRSG
ncbi:MAG: hypothetical protein ACRENE_09230, partial [Polyangiaceae bacterium]